MINITFLFIIIFLATGLFLLKNLINPNLKAFRSYAWLLVTLLFLATSIRAITTGPLLAALPHFLFLDLPLLFLIGPVCYFMFRSTVIRGYPISEVSYWHWLMAVMAFLVLLPVYGLPEGSKLDLAAQAPTWQYLLDGLYPAQLFFYAWLMLRKAKGPKGVAAALTLGAVAFVFIVGLITHSWLLGAVSMSILLIGVLVFWYKMTKPSKGLEKDPVSNLRQQLEESMTEQKLYLQRDLSLSKLASHLGTSTNKLSHHLNHEWGTGFNDWLNSYRVNEVIRLMQIEANRRYTLEAISIMAGFRSLTTFNKVFKKHTGKTPSQYNG